jgi:hypothetical protein
VIDSNAGLVAEPVLGPPVFEPFVAVEPLAAAGLLGLPSSLLQAASARVRMIVTVLNEFFDFDPCMRAPKVFFSLVERRKGS